MSHRALLQRADQQVAEQERMVAEWAELIDRMRTEGRNVCLAEELLDVFRDHLASYRSNRDLIRERSRDRD
jgi:hypothetical protein